MMRELVMVITVPSYWLRYVEISTQKVETD